LVDGKIVKDCYFNKTVEVMSVLSYVLFKIASGTEREVAKKMTEFEEVMDADVVFGEYDSLQEWQQLIWKSYRILFQIK